MTQAAVEQALAHHAAAYAAAEPYARALKASKAAVIEAVEAYGKYTHGSGFRAYIAAPYTRVGWDAAILSSLSQRIPEVATARTETPMAGGGRVSRIKATDSG